MWFFTTYLHFLAVLVLAAVYVSVPVLDPDFVLTATIGDDIDLESKILPEPVIVELDDVPEKESTPVPIPTVDLNDLLPDPQTVENLLSKALSNLKPMPREVAAAAPPTKPAAKPAPSPAPPHAMMAGSFSVWAEPENPAPDEPYRIIVQIRMPEGTRHYNLSDLDGVVIGSDGYRKPIPGMRRATLPVVNGFVRYEVPIVSADEMVEDIIFVRSRMLREAQRLHVRF